MKTRADLLATRALQIWKPISTSFVKKMRSKNLSIINDPAEYFTGSKPTEFRIDEETVPVKQWVDLYVQVVAYLYHKAPDRIDCFARSENSRGIDGYFCTKPRDKFKQIAENVYLFSHTSTWDKLRILKILCGIYGVDDITVTINDEPTLNLEQQFKKYLSDISADQVNVKCIEDLHAVEVILQDADYLDGSIFEVASQDKIQSIRDYLANNADFIEKNQAESNKYTDALNQYTAFLAVLDV